VILICLTGVHGALPGSGVAHSSVAFRQQHRKSRVDQARVCGFIGYLEYLGAIVVALKQRAVKRGQLSAPHVVRTALVVKPAKTGVYRRRVWACSAFPRLLVCCLQFCSNCSL